MDPWETSPRRVLFIVEEQTGFILFETGVFLQISGIPGLLEFLAFIQLSAGIAA